MYLALKGLQHTDFERCSSEFRRFHD